MILDRHRSVPLRLRELMAADLADLDFICRRLTDDLGHPFMLKQLQDLIYGNRILGFEVLIRLEHVLNTEYPQQVNGHANQRTSSVCPPSSAEAPSSNGV
jgi:hypothetical protein